MGLNVSIYRAEYNSPHCIFGGWQNITIVNVEGPFDPTLDAPAAILTTNAYGHPIIVPDMTWMHEHGSYGNVYPHGRFAFGGSYAGTTDSRFSDALRGRMNTHGYFAVPVHDYSLELEGQA